MPTAIYLYNQLRFTRRMIDRIGQEAGAGRCLFDFKRLAIYDQL